MFRREKSTWLSRQTSICLLFVSLSTGFSVGASEWARTWWLPVSRVRPAPTFAWPFVCVDQVGSVTKCEVVSCWVPIPQSGRRSFFRCRHHSRCCLFFVVFLHFVYVLSPFSSGLFILAWTVGELSAVLLRNISRALREDLSVSRRKVVWVRW